MTSPDVAQSPSNLVIPPATHVPNGAPGSHARSAVVASNPSKDTGSQKGAEHVAKASPTGNGGGLRQAVQELAASVECLCGDAGSRGPSGAMQHLQEVKRILGGMTRDGEARRGSDAPSSPPGIPGTRTGGVYDIQQDLQRSMR